MTNLSLTTSLLTKQKRNSHIVCALTDAQADTLLELETKLQSKNFHPYAIPTHCKTVLQTTNYKRTCCMRRLWLARLSSTCNMHDVHAGAQLQVEAIYGDRASREDEISVETRRRRRRRRRRRTCCK